MITITKPQPADPENWITCGWTCDVCGFSEDVVDVHEGDFLLTEYLDSGDPHDLIGSQLTQVVVRGKLLDLCDRCLSAAVTAYLTPRPA